MPTSKAAAAQGRGSQTCCHTAPGPISFVKEVAFPGLGLMKSHEQVPGSDVRGEWKCSGRAAGVGPRGPQSILDAVMNHTISPGEALEGSRV